MGIGSVAPVQQKPASLCPVAKSPGAAAAARDQNGVLPAIVWNAARDGLDCCPRSAGMPPAISVESRPRPGGIRRTRGRQAEKNVVPARSPHAKRRPNRRQRCLGAWGEISDRWRRPVPEAVKADRTAALAALPAKHWHLAMKTGRVALSALACAILSRSRTDYCQAWQVQRAGLHTL